MWFTFPGKRGNLYYCAFAANLASLAIGTHYSWSSPSLPKLQASDSWIKISDEESSWIGSLLSLGTAFGPFLGGWLINSVGRRWTIITSAAIAVVAWLILIFATFSVSVWQIYIGRILGGIGGGIGFMAIPSYVAEISEPIVRGALGSLFAFFLVGGYMIEYAVGPYVSYTILIIISLVPYAVFIIFFWFTPESPYYYVQNGDSYKALESLKWLRTGRDLNSVKNELKDIEDEVRKSKEEKAKVLDLFATRGSIMALFLACAMVGGQQFSGVNVILFYGQQIFELAGSTIDSSICQIIIGAILFGCGALTIPLTRAFGMKNMLIFSAIGMTVFQAVLGVYFYLYSSGKDLTSIGWLPLLSMMGYIFTYTVGFGPLPWAVMAEIFPTKLRGLGSSITTFFCWFVSFLLTKFFNNIINYFNKCVPFFFFAVCCVLSLLITVFLLPDTRGMTLQEILDLLNHWPSARSKKGQKNETRVDESVSK